MARRIRLYPARTARPRAELADHELWVAFCRHSEENMLALLSEVR